MKKNQDIKTYLIIFLVISALLNIYYFGGLTISKMKEDAYMGGKEEIINKIFENVQRTGGATITNAEGQALLLVPATTTR